ncbi:hypothetical protein TNCV_518251 [Trichonephila clavipes]|nr:hypothetical protein TNCV_518251 [Trichonephila clavipes]
MMLGMAKVVFSILLSGMTAIGRAMESGKRGYGSSSGWKASMKSKPNSPVASSSKDGVKRCPACEEEYCDPPTEE